MYLSWLLGSPPSSLGIMYSYKGFLSQLVKALCFSWWHSYRRFLSQDRISRAPPLPAPGNVSEIVPEAPLLHTVSRTLCSSCALFACNTQTPGNFIRLSSGLRSQLMRHVFLLLPEPPVLSSLWDCDGEDPAFISPLAAHSQLLPNNFTM